MVLSKVQNIYFGLPEILERWHNNYIDEEMFFPKITEYFQLREVVSYQSTYFLLSRTLNALLTPEGEEIDYLSKLNQLSRKLPSLGDYSPAKLFILKSLR